jgi:hypothetical protein
MLEMSKKAELFLIELVVTTCDRTFCYYFVVFDEQRVLVDKAEEFQCIFKMPLTQLSNCQAANKKQALIKIPAKNKLSKKHTYFCGIVQINIMYGH